MCMPGDPNQFLEGKLFNYETLPALVERAVAHPHVGAHIQIAHIEGLSFWQANLCSVRLPWQREAFKIPTGP